MHERINSLKADPETIIYAGVSPGHLESSLVPSLTYSYINSALGSYCYYLLNISQILPALTHLLDIHHYQAFRVFATPLRVIHIPQCYPSNVQMLRLLLRLLMSLPKIFKWHPTIFRIKFKFPSMVYKIP